MGRRATHHVRGHYALAAAMGLVAGIGLLAAGSALWLERGRDRAALLPLLIGVAWFAPDWVGWEEGPSTVRSVGAVVAPFLPALLLDLAATVTGGRVARLTSNAVYAGTVVVSVAGRSSVIRYSIRIAGATARTTSSLWMPTGESPEPSTPRCRASPSPRRPRDPPSPSGRQSSRAQLLVAPSCLSSSHCVRRCGRSRLRPRLDPRPGGKPRARGAPPLYIAAGGALSLVALAAGWTIACAQRTRSAVARLASDLGTAPAAGALAPRLPARSEILASTSPIPSMTGSSTATDDPSQAATAPATPLVAQYVPSWSSCTRGRRAARGAGTRARIGGAASDRERALAGGGALPPR